MGKKYFRFWVSILIIVAGLHFVSGLLFQILVPYIEKTSFIWNQIRERRILAGKYDFVIMGDSQLMSGINPILLNRHLAKANGPVKFLFFPRPSEQPEGILLNLEKLESSGIDFDHLIVNISPVTVSKNNIVEAHKSLVVNFGNFSLSLLFDQELNRFYLKNLSGTVYYIFSRLFPLFRLNSNLSAELRILPNNEKLNDLTKDLHLFFQDELFGSLMQRRNENLFLENYLAMNEFYWEWGNISGKNEKCVLNARPVKLPQGIERAFKFPRKEALKSWFAIIKKLKDKRTTFLYIPFSPETESKIGSDERESPIMMSLDEIAKILPRKNLRIFSKDMFKAEDFADYTHLNVCGMEKLTKTLSDFIIEGN